MKYQWKLTTDSKDNFEGRDRKTGAVKWRAIRADLIFGTNSQLRGTAEVYACTDSHEEFVKIPSPPGNNVMNLDR